MRLALDWDGVLADPKTHKLTPDSLHAARRILSAGHEIIVHSCRANWPEGIVDLEAQLQNARLPILIWHGYGKPEADLYLDDRGHKFTTWNDLYQELRTKGRR